MVLTKGMAEPQPMKSSPPEEHKLLMDRVFQKVREDMNSFLANHLSSFEALNLNVSGLINELEDHTCQTSSQLGQLDQDIEKTGERDESRLQGIKGVVLRIDRTVTQIGHRDGEDFTHDCYPGVIVSQFEDYVKSAQENDSGYPHGLNSASNELYGEIDEGFISL